MVRPRERTLKPMRRCSVYRAITSTVAREQVEARNQLEAYLYSVRSTAEEALKDKLDEADKEMLITTAKDGLTWLEDNVNVCKDEIEDKRKEVEAIANPIISKAYGTSGPGGEGEPQEEAAPGPDVEEVD